MMSFWEFIDKQAERVDFKHIIAFAIVAYVFWIFRLVIFNQLPESADKYASQIITGLIGILTMVLAFWFSASSEKKATNTNSNSGSVAILLLMCILFISSCATERNFVKFHDKNKSKATRKGLVDTTTAHYCSAWFPVVETTTTSQEHKEGKPDTFRTPPVVIYADCDSAYRAAKAAAEASGSKNIVVPSVSVKAPGSTHTSRIDTVYKYIRTTKEGGPKMEIAQSKIVYLESKLGDQMKKTEHENESKKKWRKAALWEGGILLAIIIIAAIRIYYGWKVRAIKNAGKFIS